jgi:hypothetical protein
MRAMKTNSPVPTPGLWNDLAAATALAVNFCGAVAAHPAGCGGHWSDPAEKGPRTYDPRLTALTLNNNPPPSI